MPLPSLLHLYFKMGTVKTVLFDIGNVLLSFDHKRAAKQLAKVTELSPERIWEEFYASGMELAYELGSISTADMIAAIRKIAIRKDFSDHDLLKAAGDIFVPKKDVIELVGPLKNNGYRLGLLSNTCEAHWMFFSKAYPVFARFDARTLSFEVKAMKPEAKIFEDAVAKACCRPEDCFYTDDIPEYVDAAKKLGLRAHVFTNAETLRKDMQNEGIHLTA